MCAYGRQRSMDGVITVINDKQGEDKKIYILYIYTTRKCGVVFVLATIVSDVPCCVRTLLT